MLSEDFLTNLKYQVDIQEICQQVFLWYFLYPGQDEPFINFSSIPIIPKPHLYGGPVHL